MFKQQFSSLGWAIGEKSSVNVQLYLKSDLLMCVVKVFWAVRVKDFL